MNSLFYWAPSNHLIWSNQFRSHLTREVHNNYRFLFKKKKTATIQKLAEFAVVYILTLMIRANICQHNLVFNNHLNKINYVSVYFNNSIWKPIHVPLFLQALSFLYNTGAWNYTVRTFYTLDTSNVDKLLIHAYSTTSGPSCELFHEQLDSIIHQQSEENLWKASPSGRLCPILPSSLWRWICVHNSNRTVFPVQADSANTLCARLFETNCEVLGKNLITVFFIR